MSSTSSDIVIPIVVIAAVVVLLGSFGGGMMGLGCFGGLSGYGFGSMGAFGWLVMSLSAIALVLAIVWLVRQLSERGGKR